MVACVLAGMDARSIATQTGRASIHMQPAIFHCLIKRGCIFPHSHNHRAKRRTKTDYLNLLQMTAMMRMTNTVMMAMVISRFVAILFWELA